MSFSIYERMHAAYTIASQEADARRDAEFEMRFESARQLKNPEERAEKLRKLLDEYKALPSYKVSREMLNG